MEWTAVHTTTVVPAKPIRDHWLPLSNLDRVVMPTYVRALLVYKVDGGGHGNQKSYGDLIETLKCSLARVLVDFYPLAGRLGVQEHGMVNLHCNGAGAVFTEAAVNRSLEDLDITRHMSTFSGVDAAELGPGPLFIPSRDLHVPPLIIQVTHLRCGNIVLGVNWHHTVADMYSGHHFLKSWSELAFGHTQPSLRPVHSRHLVKPRNDPNPAATEVWANITRVDTGAREVPPDPPTALCTFNLSRRTTECLEREANSCEPDHLIVDVHKAEGESPSNHRSPPFTMTESVLAHFWRLLAKARRAEEVEDEDNISRLFIFVEGRKYLRLPAGYFGNVVGCACAVSTEERLMSASLASSAFLLRSAVANVSCSEFFHSLIDWVEEQRLSSSRHEQGISLEHYVAAMSWTLPSLFDLDFGFGRPTGALTNPAPRRLFDSLIILPGPHPDADQRALLNIRASCLSRLEADPEFNSQFKLLRNASLLCSQ